MKDYVIEVEWTTRTTLEVNASSESAAKIAAVKLAQISEGGQLILDMRVLSCEQS